MSDHPSLRQLAAFLDGRLTEQEREAVEQHVADCETCCENMSRIPQDTLSARLQDVETGASASFIVQRETSAPPTTSSQIPAELVEHPRYRILEPLGHGGMGVVYKAQHRLMDRLVALKVIDHQLIGNPQAIVRFRNEVKAAARLSHANIVRAYDAEQEGKLHFLVMEFVDGVSLAEYVRRIGPLPIHQACGVIRKVAKALDHACQQGMVHRDIKPQNIMVTREGRVCVLDFGLARLIHEREREASDKEDPADQLHRTASALTLIGSVLGTPDYIAPEQVTDPHSADTRADLYSLGCTFYFLLTGKPPYPTGTVMQKLVAHRDGSPPPVTTLRADTPSAVADIVARMMAREPRERFQQPADVVEAIEAITSGLESAIDEVDENRSAHSTSLDQHLSVHSANPTAETERQPSGPAEFTVVPAPVGLPIMNPDRSGSQSRRRVKKSGRRPTRWLWPVVTVIAVLTIIAGVATLSSNHDTTVESASSENSTVPAALSNDMDADSNHGAWTDLLAEIDPAANSESGQWSREGEGLIAAAAPYAKLRLLPDVPEEYDLEVTFTRTSGEDSVALIFATQSQQATFEIDAWQQQLAGIQLINGHNLQQPANPTRVADLRLVNGRQYTVSLQVRRNRIDVWLDGSPLTTFVNDGSTLSPLPDWALTDSSAIGVGAYQSETIFHRIRFRQVNRETH
ncbi:MAG: protein kinase [Planctomycetaceae bacterium]|nr:protein kinase [Planctomycetaceae bacterium]